LVFQIAPNGRTFFIDHRTKTTTWLDPRTGIAASRPVSGKTDDEIGALPEGWEQRDPRFENESIAGPAIPYSRDYKRKVCDISIVKASSYFLGLSNSTFAIATGSIIFDVC
ncbi:hypothetical protein TELCIR_15694, partial [Teladorsagia circumcincta]